MSAFLSLSLVQSLCLTRGKAKRRSGRVIRDREVREEWGRGKRSNHVPAPRIYSAGNDDQSGEENDMRHGRAKEKEKRKSTAKQNTTNDRRSNADHKSDLMWNASGKERLLLIASFAEDVGIGKRKECCSFSSRDRLADVVMPNVCLPFV